MVAAYYVFVVLVLALAFYLDTRRAFAYKNKPAEICLAGEKHRWAVYYALVVRFAGGVHHTERRIWEQRIRYVCGVLTPRLPRGEGGATAPGEGVCTAIAHEWVAAANSPLISQRTSR